MDDGGRLTATRTHAPAERPAGARRSYFIVITGSTSSSISLPRNGALLVGRAPESDVVLTDDAASRRHVRISVVDGEVEVTDLDSHNGTRLNGQPLVGARPLRSGDVVSIGDTTMVLHASAVVGPRVLADAAGLRGRLADEVERALGFERPLAVIAIRLGERLGARAALAIEERLRPYDLAGWLDDTCFAILAPELDGDAADAFALRIVETLVPLDPGARAGIADCPADGCDADALLEAARTAAETAKPGEHARAEGSAHRLEIDGRSILVADPAMVRLYELVRRLAATQLSVLITGETGVGKENAAFAVHYYSPRRGGPFITLNSAALPEHLVESELFGHEKGSFTGATGTKLGLLESARGGTVFLDELGELQPAVQAKLLRAVEARRVTRVGGLKEHEIDIRLVAATHRDLEADVAAGRFRRDLLFRIGQASVVLPPLRDRPREIALLAREFLTAACTAAKREPLHVSSRALQKLSRYAWPGNVRELRNVMEVAAATVNDDTLEPWHLPRPIGGSAAIAPPHADPPAAPEEVPQGFLPLADEIRDLERRRMSEALVATRGNRTRAADLLKVPLRTFLLRIKQYGLTDVGRDGA